MSTYKLLPAGEQGLIVEFGETIDPAINRQVQNLADTLNRLEIRGLIELVPTYRSLMVYFDPLVLPRDKLSAHISTLLNEMTLAPKETLETRVLTIPVCYGGEFGPDIDFVAKHNSITVSEVINIHTSTPYLVYMLGFTPGFPYLGRLSPRLATPRLLTPRTVVPAGSVGIADTQTGLYPVESPGGWQIIGRTPVKAFDPMASNPFLFKAGDYIEFQSIDEKSFYIIKHNVEIGAYIPSLQYTRLSRKDSGA